MLFVSFGIVIAGIVFIWAATIKIPDLKSFDNRKIQQSTKIYDRTGQVVLYDVHQDIKRTEISFLDMGTNIKNATVAIEDSEFYQHSGIRLKSILRAILADIFHGGFSQGGSTITQQVVKRTLLTSEKTISRKVKEWILSIKLEQVVSKEDILATYLNEAPYGGNIYGVEEAAQTYFGKDAKDLTLAEAAYMAAMPQAPTFYSPYGQNRSELEKRKNTVLARMKELKFITDSDYQNALAEQITFKPQAPTGIQAPHFVMYIKSYLEQKYGQDAMESGGLKVITTLDATMQQKAEEIVKKYALQNEVKFKGKNAGMTAIDPKTGQILVMVGSRDYFDKEIDGNYNITLAHRQPGSSFKPFAYVTAFKKGYTPNTVLFDVPTEFQTTCDAYGKALPGYNQDDCYMPGNYDDKFRGPMTLRDALAQSINVPSVKVLYLAGIADSLKTAKDMGIKTLTNANQYGLTLVLGGGEVTLLDMTSAYSVFADEGVRHPAVSILKVEDGAGNTLEEYKDQSETVLPKNETLMITDILSDNVARTPLEGANSPLYFPGRDVAVKTGTTNDYRDAWILGYTPSIAVGAWAGNNDNTPMEHKISGLIVAPMWNEFMNEVLKTLPDEKFEKPDIKNDPNIGAPVIRGLWQGGDSFLIDTISGKLATENTPKETTQEKVITNFHSILYWVDKSDPLGPKPADPSQDPQFERWEIAERNWWQNNAWRYPVVTTKPTLYDDVHTPANKPNVNILTPSSEAVYDSHQPIAMTISSLGHYPLQKIDIFINNDYVGTIKSPNFSFSFIPSDLNNLQNQNELKLIAYDTVWNSSQITKTFRVSNP